MTWGGGKVGTQFFLLPSRKGLVLYPRVRLVEEFSVEPSKLQRPPPQRPVLLFRAVLAVSWRWGYSPQCSVSWTNLSGRQAQAGVWREEGNLPSSFLYSTPQISISRTQSHSPLYIGYYLFKYTSLSQGVPNGSAPDLGSSHGQPIVYQRAKRSLSFSMGPPMGRCFKNIPPNKFKFPLFFQFHNDFFLDLWVQFPSKSSWLSSISHHLPTYMHISTHTYTLLCSKRPHKEVAKHTVESVVKWQTKIRGWLRA